MGNQISINCNASGVPSPNITISKKTAESNSGLGVVSNKYSFTITAARSIDEGIYVCMAENEAGISKVEITLTVLGISCILRIIKRLRRGSFLPRMPLFFVYIH